MFKNWERWNANCRPRHSMRDEVSQMGHLFAARKSMESIEETLRTLREENGEASLGLENKTLEPARPDTWIRTVSVVSRIKCYAWLCYLFKVWWNTQSLLETWLLQNGFSSLTRMSTPIDSILLVLHSNIHDYSVNRRLNKNKQRSSGRNRFWNNFPWFISFFFSLF